MQVHALVRNVTSKTHVRSSSGSSKDNHSCMSSRSVTNANVTAIGAPSWSTVRSFLVPLETRFATAEDLPSIWDVFVRSFDFPPDRFQEWLLDPGPDRVFGAFDEHGRAVAGSRLVAFGQWYGGQRVPMAGYSPVAVTPEHR